MALSLSPNAAPSKSFIPASATASPLFHRRHLPLSPPPPLPLAVKLSHTRRSSFAIHASQNQKEQKFTDEGLITESLPNGMFRVRLDGGDLVLGYISGKIRRSFIRILPGDRVKVEVSRYDSTKARIVYRLRGNKDSNE